MTFWPVCGPVLSLTAAQTVKNHINRPCRINKNGEYYTGFPSVIGGMTCFFSACFGLCIAGIAVLEIAAGGRYATGESAWEEPVIVALSFFMMLAGIGWSVYFFKMKWTLAKGFLLCEKPWHIQRTSYQELKECAEVWPPVHYKGKIIFMTRNNILRLDPNWEGWLDFLKELCFNIKIEPPAKEVVDSCAKWLRWRTTAQEREAYKERKKWLKIQRRRCAKLQKPF